MTIAYFEAAAAAFLCVSQRRFTASAIRFRPSGVRRLFLRATFFAGVCAAEVAIAFLGLPAGFLGAAPVGPLSSARTCFSNAISRSTDFTISDTPINPPLIAIGNPAFAGSLASQHN
jgi:hypothetical protein